MRTAIAIVCFGLSIFAFIYGVVTEYRQSREGGPIARVPTLPWAIEAALLIVLGLYWLPQPIRWWVYLAAFSGSVLIFGFIINAARGRKTRK